MSNEVETAFKQVYALLDRKEQQKAMRGAMRKEANRLKRTAATALKSSGIGRGTSEPLDKGVYTRVFPDRYGLGFMVSVKPFRRKGVHRNRQGKEKPVLMWAEDGTRFRRIGRKISSFKGKSRFSMRNIRHYARGGASRGRMKPYNFLKRTEQTEANQVGENLYSALENNINRIAQKKGLL